MIQIAIQIVKILSAVLAMASHLRLDAALAVFIVCATMAIGSTRLFQQPILPVDIAIAACYAAMIWAIYLFNKAYDQQEDAISKPAEVAHRAGPFLLAAAVLAVGAVTVLAVLQQTLWCSGVILTAGFLYSFPMGGWRIKNVFMLKNILTVVILFPPIICIPVYHMNLHVSLAMVLSQCWPLALLILAFTMLLDICDVTGDRAAGVRTCPVLLGILPTRLLIWLLLFLVLMRADFTMTNEPISFFAALYLFMVSLWVAPGQPTWWYHGIVYGFVIVVGLMAWFQFFGAGYYRA